MNILVVNGYVRENKGDAALMSVLCQELDNMFKSAVIKVSNQEDLGEHPTFEKWENVGSFMHYASEPSISKARRAFRILGCFLLPLAITRKSSSLLVLFSPRLRAQLNLYRASELVVSMGGGYLNGAPNITETLGVYLMLMPMIVSKRLGKCVICAPQSMGPFGNKLQEWMVRRGLRNVNLIMTREDVTTTLLKQLKIEAPIVKSIDSGFLFNTQEKIDLRKQLHIPKKSLLIGITVRKWLDEEKQAKYENAIACTADKLIAEYNASIVFIPQVTSRLGGDDDRATSEDVYKHIKHKGSVYLLQENYDHYSIKALYNSLDLIIGTRFHSVIFSLTSYVPAVAIEYEHKTRGIMHDLGLDDWVIKIGDVNKKNLTDKVSRLIGSRNEYKAHLRKVLPQYIEKAHEASTMMRKTYISSLD